MPNNHQDFVVVVIESSGKIDAFRSALSTEFKNFRVLATHGRLLDFAEGFSANSGLDNTQSYLNLRSPVKPSVHNLIKQNIKEASAVYCFTDNDAEGELIAWDVQNLSLYNSTRFYRCFTNVITKEFILKGLRNPSSICTERVKEALSKRVLNRMVGYRLSERRNVIGRSISPTLNLYKSNKYIANLARVTHLGNDGGIYEASFKLMPGQVAPSPEMLPKLLEGQALEAAERAGVSFDDALSACLVDTDLTATTIIDAFQSLFEKGAISYFRTEGKGYISGHSESGFCGATNYYRGASCAASFAQPLPSEPHEGIYLSNTTPSLTDIETLVIKALSRDYLKRYHSQSTHIIQTPSHGSAELIVAQKGRWLFPHQDISTSRALDKQSSAILSSRAYELTTPSSCASIGKKAATYIDEDYRLTAAGKENVLIAELTFAKILDIGVQASIKDTLTQSDPEELIESVSKRVQTAFNMLEPNLSEEEQMDAPRISPVKGLKT